VIGRRIVVPLESRVTFLADPLPSLRFLVPLALLDRQHPRDAQASVGVGEVRGWVSGNPLAVGSEGRREMVSSFLRFSMCESLMVRLKVSSSICFCCSLIHSSCSFIFFKVDAWSLIAVG
jgi:hypothetical protein